MIDDSPLDTAETCPPWRRVWEVFLVVLLFFLYAGDAPPEVNEAHYLAKARNFWQPNWCSEDLFVTSGKAHAFFFVTWGWPTVWLSFPAAAWIGRLAGWILLAIGLQRVSWSVVPRRYASLLVAVIWIVLIHHTDLAGEWVIGGIEAKIPAWALVLLALERMIQGRWVFVWPLLGLASAFHVIVGGWAVVLAALTFLVRGRPQAALADQVLPLVLGGLVSLLGLLPAMALNTGVSSEQSLAAARTYVYQRLNHHLLPSAFPWHWYARHFALVALVGLAVVLSRDRLRRRPGGDRHGQRLAVALWFCAGGLMLALIGLLVGLLPAHAPDLAARMLRFYWFRMTDVLIPLAAALTLASWLPRPPRALPRRLGRSIPLLVALGCALWMGERYLQRARLGIPPGERAAWAPAMRAAPLERQQQAYRDWVAVCHWARDNTPEDEVFLTPRHQQTFKWHAERAEVVNWKDVPQDARSLLEWSRRMDQVFPLRLGRARVSIRYQTLRDLRSRYGVNYLIVDRRVVRGHVPLVSVYPEAFDENGTYAVYRLPP